MAKEKPGPKGEDKPMGMTSEVTPEEQIEAIRAEMRRELAQVKEIINKLWRHHFGGNAL